MAKLNKTIWISSLFFLILLLALYAPSYHNQSLIRSEIRHTNNINVHDRERVLLLTAHPDDECMFFAPTLLGLTGERRTQYEKSSETDEYFSKSGTRADVFSLCLSSGNADGLGEMRKRELNGSLDILGIRDEGRWVLDEPFHDNITLYWDAQLIAEHVKPFIENNKINTILTFDIRGISSHPNHISLAHGVRRLLADSPRKDLRAFSLRTTSLLPKYTGVASALSIKLEEAFCFTLPKLFFLKYLPLQSLPPFMEILRITDCTKFDDGEEETDRVLFVSGWSEYVTALRAMRAHQSQLVWFRWLYVLFSRYMWVNEWTEIIVDSI